MTSIGGASGAMTVPMRNLPGQKPPGFDTIDADRSGSLSLDEVKAAAPGKADAGRLESMFKALDSDGDGGVSKAEDEAFRARMREGRSLEAGLQFGVQQGAGGPPSADDLLSALDANGDGSVTKDDFASEETSAGDRMASRLFDALDGDGDGTVSKAETTSFLDDLEATRPQPRSDRASGSDRAGAGGLSQALLDLARGAYDGATRLAERDGASAGRSGGQVAGA